MARLHAPRRRSPAASLLALAAAALLARGARAASFPAAACPSSGGGGYFDTSSLTCASCSALGAGLVADNSSSAGGAAGGELYGPAGCACARASALSLPACSSSGGGPACAPPVCTPCAGAAPAASRSFPGLCLPCDANATLGFDAALGDCRCPPPTANGTTYRLVDASPTGDALPAKACAACPPATRAFWSPTGSRAADYALCVSCGGAGAVTNADGSCACAPGYRAVGTPAPGGALACVTTADAAVLASYSEASATLASFYSVQTAVGGPATGAVTGLASRTLAAAYAPAAVGCRLWRAGTPPAACHALAHLCVLAMYLKSATPCALFLAITAPTAGRAGTVNGLAGWAAGAPVLYWPASPPALATDTSLPAKMAFKPGAGAGAAVRLEFYLASYALNGSFLGLAPLANQLAHCAAPAGAAPPPAWLSFGHSMSTTYACDVRALARAGAPVFYDLFVRDLAADGVTAAGAPAQDAVFTAFTAAGLATPPLLLLPVPVRVVNYRDDAGARPNVNAARADEADDVLTGRFTLVDAASGVTAAPPALPQYVRYAVRATLTLRTLAGAPAVLSPPVLTLQFVERPVAAALADAAGGVAPAGMGADALTVAAEYEGDYAGYQNSVAALAAVAGVLVALWASGALAAHQRMNARSQYEGAVGLLAAGRFLALAVSVFAVVFAGYLWLVCAYWLAYFKLQDSVYSLLPVNRPGNTDNPYAAFAGVLVAVFVAYSARLALLVHAQVSADVFFLDWEKPRGAVLRGAPGDADAGGGSGSGGSGGGGAPPPAGGAARLTPVSVWRTVIAANEWCALSASRRTDPALTLALVVVILQGAGLKYVATPQPLIADLTPGALNPALAFANTAFWFAVVVACQLAFAKLVGERFLTENPTTRFLDLCTVMKVSTLLLDHRYRGFYVHANAPHEHADGEMAELAAHLYEEAAALRVGRGLPGAPDAGCQTFEVHLPALWRENYDRIFRRLLDSESALVEAYAVAPGGGGAAFGGGFGGGAGVGGGGGGGAELSAPGVLGALARSRERTRRLAAAHGALAAFLRGFVEESDPDYKRVWHERTVLHAAFDFPPDTLMDAVSGGGAPGSADGSTATSPGRLTIMYTDRRMRFERLTFRGIEGDLAAWDALLFCVVDWATGGNTVAAALATFVLTTALSRARLYLGQRAVAYKTLIDARFLN